MERKVIGRRGKIRPNPSFFPLVLWLTICNPSMHRSLSGNSNTGRLFWLWYKLDYWPTQICFQADGIYRWNSCMQATKVSSCTNFEWQAVWLMQGQEEAHVGSFGKLLWWATAPPVPTWAVVRKDIERWGVACLLFSFYQSEWISTNTCIPGGERIKHSKDISLAGCCHYPPSEQGLQSP